MVRHQAPINSRKLSQMTKLLVSDYRYVEPIADLKKLKFTFKKLFLFMMCKLQLLLFSLAEDTAEVIKDVMRGECFKMST